MASEADKAEIVSKQTIKPSSPTPLHLTHHKLSFLDQLAPHFYTSVIFFFFSSASSHVTTSSFPDFSSLSAKLKASLSDVLALYYPLCGTIKGNTYVECNDAGVLYLEARVPFSLSEILEDPRPQVDALKQFFPFDPYEPGADCNINEEPAIMGVQVSEFSCGGVALGVCISHRVVDGKAASSFLNAWAAEAARRGSGSTVAITAPHMEGGLPFPAVKDLNIPMSTVYGSEGIVTRRLVFEGANLSKLKASMEGFNPTRVEAVTALIWKSAMEAAAGEHTVLCASHVVDIRSHMVPPLPDNSFGNFIVTIFCELPEPAGIMEEKQVELQDLAVLVRKAIRKVDEDHVSKLKGDGGFSKAVEPFKEAMTKFSQGGVTWFCFSSWARLPLYEVDFGWGKPSWVCSLGARPGRSGVKLLPTRSGDGIEAWVNLTQQHMAQFENNPELLKYASFSSL